jgi:hypothetical protein
MLKHRMSPPQAPKASSQPGRVAEASKVAAQPAGLGAPQASPKPKQPVHVQQSPSVRAVQQQQQLSRERLATTGTQLPGQGVMYSTQLPAQGVMYTQYPPVRPQSGRAPASAAPPPYAEQQFPQQPYSQRSLPPPQLHGVQHGGEKQMYPDPISSYYSNVGIQDMYWQPVSSQQ